MITERLQADFDTEGTPEEEVATTALMATQQQQRPRGEPIPTLQGQAAMVPPVEEADVAEHSSAAAQQGATTGEDGGAEAEREPAPDRQAPRPFVVEFAQAWKAGALIPAERRMIYEMLEQYPLEREAA